jgi:hypothetical protein
MSKKSHRDKVAERKFKRKFQRIVNNHSTQLANAIDANILESIYEQEIIHQQRGPDYTT